ncbi:unnamed protein product [Arctia plantaginis]|uniref:Malate dehydrogenase n=1 Tax=Arctia plantaginis TaxID=874455 RepID=A0A8S1A7C9_ARCPL|nr:unnamed protein product [Arctia plantaginis]
MEADKGMARVVTEEACRFIVDCLHAAGANQEAAAQQAKLLIEAEKLGHPSHGMNRLEFYINDILSGACDPNSKPTILKETASTAWIDAKNVLGATSSHFAMDTAMTKARQTGVAWVVVKGANHFGIAGYWAQKAADQGLIGMSFSNTSPVCAPTRSKEAALGTNPFSCVAPGSSGESFYLDMATTAVALGKIEMQIRKGEPIPPGWAQGPDGNETRDAQLAFDTRCLYPLGGSELTSGYKGYGLGAMVELFCGILGGSKYGHYIRAWSHESDGTPADLGHCFVAIDPNCFAPGFGDRLTDLVQHWRNLEPMDPNLPVLAPGDKEKLAAAKSDETGTISFVPQQIESCLALAKKLKVKPMECL